MPIRTSNIILSAIWLLVNSMLNTSVAQTIGNEELNILRSNTVLSNQSNTTFKQQKSSLRFSLLTLPFLEDFNQIGFYPDAIRWEDNFTYINNTYPVNPPTLGVATLDGLDAEGQPYSTNLTITDRADKLTSLPFSLATFNEADSVYLSFFYQSGGLGDKPESNIDFLLLEFLDNSGTWKTVWNANPTDTIPPFTQAFVKLTTPYLFDGFQFRFVNIARLAGNNDLWHLDYIKLDKGRIPAFEQNINDVAYTTSGSSVLKEYYSLPYKHFKDTLLLDTIKVNVRNNFPNTVDYVDRYFLFNLADSSVLDAYSGPSIDIAGNSDNIFNYNGIDIPAGLNGDTIRLGLEYSFQTSAENNAIEQVKANNILRKKIEFNNFFALDDGSAERAYRLRNFDFGKIALRFTTQVPDTLQSVRFHFAFVNNDYSGTRFNLVIWKILDSTDRDAVELYREDNLSISDLRKPFGNEYNGFSYYRFKPELNNGNEFIPLEAGDFFVGIELNKDNILDIGFDLNNDNGKRHFFNIGDGWFQTQFPGALMINPIVGKPLDWPYVKVNDKYRFIEMEVFPNPAINTLKMRKKDPSTFRFKIMDITGQIMNSGIWQDNTHQLDLSTYNAGIYILIIEDESGMFAGRTKFVKQ